MLAPGVTPTTTGHPVHPARRTDFGRFSEPIVIEDKVGIGSNAVVLPGVRIGYGSVIGAGSVVSSSTPPTTVALGTPCRVVRALTDEASPPVPPNRKWRRPAVSRGLGRHRRPRPAAAAPPVLHRRPSARPRRAVPEPTGSPRLSCGLRLRGRAGPGGRRRRRCRRDGHGGATGR
ncbi:DapH/DapD/GlmU-related protein [Streptomyces sp. NPDC059454]|uniref:DapH/DapD/GlmU-related protein n=1 Tax=Streptomyces sp. NPDC059454 TaxID=3346836 RepID=UPI003691C16E